MSKKHIIIGTSAAGITVAQKLRALDADATITCISDEHELPYNKCKLADYVSGACPQAPYIFSAEQAHAMNIQLMLATRITAINPHEKKVITKNSELSYDILFIGTGSSCVLPPISGIHDVRGVYTFHTLYDVHHIMEYIKQNKVQRVVVIGAGLSGLECADALLHHGLSITIVEQHEYVLTRHLDEISARFIEKYIARHGVTLLTSTRVQKIIAGDDNHVRSVMLSSGAEIVADMVICATGLKPNSEIAHNIGIAMRDGSIIVDEYMRTTVTDIYAGGDVALVKNQLTGEYIRSSAWPDAIHQGMIAAHTIAGQPRPYPGLIPTLSSAFFGIKFAVCGDTAVIPSSWKVVVKEYDNTYQCVALTPENRLGGFILMGPTIAAIGTFKRALMMRQIIEKSWIYGI